MPARPIAADNIDRIVQDLKDDLKVEKFSDQEDTLDQLLALAVTGLEVDTDTESLKEENRELEETIRDMKRAFEKIEDIAVDYS